MTIAAPQRARQSYRHEAFLWGDRDEYVAGLVPFVVEGLGAGETVLVGATPEHAGWLSHELGPRVDEVSFVDLGQLAHNPARIMLALQELLAGCCAPGRPARAIGEPVWPGRRSEEVGEARLHEALLNLAVDPDLPFWLVCPYDTASLDADELADAARSHPVMATATSYAGSAGYRGRDHAQALFSAALVDLGTPSVDVRAGDRTLEVVAEHVTLQAAASNLPSDQVVALTDLVRGLVTASVRRGADRARVRLWDRPAELVCEVADATVIEDLLVGRRLPASTQRDPLWSANQLCDLVQVRSGPRGTTVRLHLTT